MRGELIIMKIFHALTAVLFLLKVLNMISVSWWVVAAPSLIALSAGLLLFLVAIIIAVASEK